MVRKETTTNNFDAVEVIRSAFKTQYHAALAMLHQAVDRCPDDLWSDRNYPNPSWANPFWKIAYHTLYYVHFYLQQQASDFRPWEHHQTRIQDLDEFPAPPEIEELCELPHRPPQTGEPYTKAQILDYWSLCDGMVDGALDALDLLAPDCGFSWYNCTKAEHQMATIRHIQHHTAQLGVRLRETADVGIDWVGTNPS